MANLEVVFERVNEAAQQLNDVGDILETGIMVGHIASAAAAVGTAFGCVVCGDMAARFEMQVRPILEDIRDMCFKGNDYLKQVAQAMEAVDAVAEARFTDAKQIIEQMRSESLQEGIL